MKIYKLAEKDYDGLINALDKLNRELTNPKMIRNKLIRIYNGDGVNSGKYHSPQKVVEKYPVGVRTVQCDVFIHEMLHHCKEVLKIGKETSAGIWELMKHIHSKKMAKPLSVLTDKEQIITKKVISLLAKVKKLIVANLPDVMLTATGIKVNFTDICFNPLKKPKDLYFVHFDFRGLSPVVFLDQSIR
ncbi:hypothetical protein CKF54_00310 [Psittacicella hinzii]|uniref:Uncharacterized protein n=1 Tax=Psittacicella hinzii TaxID=2028575 RepID=A0A3A1Y8F0_9GAMM|nr:hypothetical protein [Psittacicella hinzii]RIY34472.1 hypothetical protein CKF54_00310 [Psittacicella hinzii]